MAYLITLTDGQILASVANYAIDTTHTSIDLPGQGYPNWGQYIVNGLVNHLENFSNTTAPSTPLAGQLWWDSLTQVMNVYNSSAWVPVSPNNSATIESIITSVGLTSSGSLNPYASTYYLVDGQSIETNLSLLDAAIHNSSGGSEQMFFNSSATLSNIGTIPGSMMYVSDNGGGIGYVNNSGVAQEIQAGGNQTNGLPNWQQPGAPNLSTWTPFGYATSCTLLSNGVNGVTIVVPEQPAISETSYLWGGYYTPAPTSTFSVMFVSTNICNITPTDAQTNGNYLSSYYGIGLRDANNNILLYRCGGNSSNTYGSDFSSNLAISSPSIYADQYNLQSVEVISDNNFYGLYMDINSQMLSNIIIKNDGTNISIIGTLDGVTGPTYYQFPVSGTISASVNINYDFSQNTDIVVAVGALDPSLVNQSTYSIFESFVSIFTFDNNAGARLPTPVPPYFNAGYWSQGGYDD